MSNNILQDPPTFFPLSVVRNSCFRALTRSLCLICVLSLFGTNVWAQSGSDKNLDRFKKEGKELSKPASQPSSKGKTAGNTGWVIIVGAFTADDQADEAERASKRLAVEGALTGVSINKRGKATVLEYGSYPTPDDPKAQEDLARIRDISINGEKQLANAFLAPPEQTEGSIPEFDLRNALKNFRGKEKPLYTLQVAVYTRDDDKAPSPKELAEFRKTAEDAASQLRREGEQAFYYHGPNRSMVTVGLFGPSDTDPLKPGMESMALREVRDRYKYNLLNGRGIKETRKGADGRGITSLQPSFLVAIPKN